MNVKIYTMTHRNFPEPEDSVYVPMHVGKAISADLGYMGDDTGENISDLNPLYGELTGLYWIWQNEQEADVIGICHYRRYFLNEAGGFMTQAEYEEALSDCDVLVSDFLSSGGSNRENFGKAHNIADMDAMGEAILKLYPADYPAFQKVMADDKSCYGNLMVTTRELFNEYCEWLFTICAEASDKIDVSEYDMYHKRVYGFLSEVLLYVWLEARGLRVKEGRIGITSEKAETLEFKQAMEQLIEKGEIAQAKELFYGYMKLRPDIRENLSDIKGEIPVIEQLLYIMHEEAKHEEKGLLDFSRNLQLLMVHYKNLVNLVQQYGENVREGGAAYLAEFPASDTALGIVGKNLRGELLLYEYLNEGKPAKKVSVIVPVYNGENQFRGCIGNLVHQTLEDVEIIFVDDCSTDNSLQILYECQRQYPDKVRVIASPDNRRAGGARNLGLDVATGEYVGFVDCDDIPDVKMFEKLYQTAKDGDYDIVEGGCIYESKGEIVVFTEDKNCGVLDAKKRSSLIMRGGYLWNKIFRRELIEKAHLRFRERVPMLEDADFLNYMFATAFSITTVKEILYRYKDTDGSLSKKRDRESYCGCLYEAMWANYDRLHGLPNYRKIRNAVEFDLIQYYSFAVNACLESHIAGESYDALGMMEKLRKLRRRIISPGYANERAQKVLQKLDLAIMQMNDDNPKKLLEVAGELKWQFSSK